VARVITDAVNRRVTCPNPVNMAFGGRTSLNALIELLEQILGRTLERETLPPRVGDVPTPKPTPRGSCHSSPL